MSQYISNPLNNPNYITLKIESFFDDIERVIQSGRLWSIGTGPLSSIGVSHNEISKIFLIHDVVQKIEYPYHVTMSFTPSLLIASNLNTAFQKWFKEDYKITDSQNEPLILYIFSNTPSLAQRTQFFRLKEKKMETLVKEGIRHNIVFKYNPISQKIVMDLSIL